MLSHYLKQLQLPTFIKSHEEVALECQKNGKGYVDFLLRLSEMEVLGRHSRAVQQKIKKAKFPSLKTLDTFNFKLLPNLDQRQVATLAGGDYIDKVENIIALGNSGTGKTHLSISLGMAACQKGASVLFTTAASLVHELIEAQEEKQFLKIQKKLNTYSLLIVDELGFVPFTKAGAELLFEVFSNRYERRSVIITTNLPFQEWTQVFGCERLTGALLDRLTHHVHILEMNGESYRLNQSKRGELSNGQKS
jgi:DNA replication protein DnaC